MGLSETARGNDGDAVAVDVGAKINPHLGVGPVRADGLHELTTVYQAVSLYDTVTVRPGKRGAGISLAIEGEGAGDLPTGEDNLAHKAAKLLALYANVEPDVDIHLRKRIPVAGGLAGGSADAAGSLVACKRLWNVDIGREQLDQLAGGLGSDVPFCLYGGTAVGTGHGEKVEPLETQASYHWVVATSHTQISTPECYKEVDRLRENGIGRYSDDIRELCRAYRDRAEPDELAHLLVNDMEAAAVSLRPDLASVMHGGLEEGALTAHVSGSGPTVLFLARDAQHASALARRVKMRGGVRAVLTAQGPVAGPEA